ncbi:hypothetical protein OGR47_20635 (plasmid) [Methylocystis sp. MJC1]|uniref:hypothetical protein n=1 Tax=Methylocystis sp. MJC1 TaxID=2654282 RepID=UPI0013EBA94F|nr:hypothetical protein [Methylocystis sp. MJC1]KAF2989274.1 hypothetical protein MJC1_03592 [Methylocystis sp. MJC1]MBU6529305.1 hypothetical protein [Methylocystis sp. MJC1]UZX14166.1 hypothetical protein OGR47_20635 [Methylocystis sp. MJC1]
MKRLIAVLFASSVALTAMGPARAAEVGRDCMPIGGVAIPNFFPEGDRKPIVISASVAGSVQNAAGKILAQRETPTGLEMDMEHYFGREDGGAIHTKDLGILTSVPGKPGRYMLEITYDIQQADSRGTLKGYGGVFNSYGLVDLRDPNNMVGLVRYGGEICK